MKKLVFFLALFVSAKAFCQDKQNIELFFVSLEKGDAQPLKEIPFKASTEKIKWGHEIKVYSDIEHQTIEGIGGAFNEIGGEALMGLNKEQREEIMDNLFSEEKAGFTFCRTAIGSSDFGINAYSYSEVAEDYEMKNFSIERDEKYVLPYLQSAFAVNPELKVFASPWSPPAWMKNNQSMTGLTKEPNTFRDEAKVYKAYANYFVKYVQAYEKNGVKLDRICVQNENDANTIYPSCVMPPAQMLELTKYILPAFKKAKLDTKVYAGTFRTAEKLDLMEFMQLKNRDIFEGVGLQYTNPSIITDAVKMDSDLKMFHTESDCYNGQNSTKQANNRLEEVASYINNGLANFCYWNMILNETTKSGWNWAQNSMINIDRENKTVQYNPDYNVMYILGHFIKPNDVRVASISHRPMITVKDANGKVKILIQNTDNEASPYRLNIDGEIKEFMIPANGITAIVYDASKKKM